MKPRSLKHVLMGGVLTANLVCSVSFSIVAILHELHGRRRAFDVMLQGRADSMLGSVGHVGAKTLSSLPGHDLFEVQDPAGKVWMRSSSVAPEMRRRMDRPSETAYFDFQWNGRPYRAIRLPMEEVGGDHQGSYIVIYAASTDDLQHEALEAAMYYCKVAIGLLLGITVLLMLFLRSRLAPLNELAVRAGRVSTNAWQFEIPIAALQTQELRPIAISIENLLQRLKLAFERQKQFTGDAAHELKTLIAILKTRLQLLTLRQRGAEEYEQGLAELLKDLHRMEDLTASMLTLARVESSDAEPMQMIDLSTVAHAMVEYVRPMATVKGVTVCVNADGSSPVRMHRMDAEILCSNLMTNAIQHSTEHSSILVSAHATGGNVELRVADCGEGIPADSVEHIFERFFRVDSSRSRQTGGVGLGLAICKAIADRSNASITVSSELGRGTEVLVTFPQQSS